MTEPGQETGLRPRRRVGRFELFTEIASGGMATVHLARVIGHSDFARVVAIKRLHPHFAKDPVFTRMFLDEARIVARIRHPNVLPTIDLIEGSGELFIVMEYIEGETFAALMREARRRKERVPVGVALRIMCGALHGLHAAHEATNERGEPMNLVHRDVSPENVMIGTDGFARLLDFGIARALGMYSQTREGEVKGKLAYMTPEQILGDPVTGRTDVFSASVVLWQALTGKQLFKGKHVGEYTHKILHKTIDPPSAVVPDLPRKLDPLVLRGLEREVGKRWPSAQAMAEAIEEAGELATQREVGVWVRRLAGDHLNVMARKVAAVENAPRNAPPRSLPPPSSNDLLDEPTSDTVDVIETPPARAVSTPPPPTAGLPSLPLPVGPAGGRPWSRASDGSLVPPPPPAPAPQGASRPPTAATPPGASRPPTAATPPRASRPPTAATPPGASRPPTAATPPRASRPPTAATPPRASRPPTTPASEATLEPAAGPPPRLVIPAPKPPPPPKHALAHPGAAAAAASAALAAAKLAALTEAAAKISIRTTEAHAESADAARHDARRATTPPEEPKTPAAPDEAADDAPGSEPRAAAATAELGRGLAAEPTPATAEDRREPEETEMSADAAVPADEEDAEGGTPDGDDLGEADAPAPAFGGALGVAPSGGRRTLGQRSGRAVVAAVLVLISVACLAVWGFGSDGSSEPAPGAPATAGSAESSSATAPTTSAAPAADAAAATGATAGSTTSSSGAEPASSSSAEPGATASGTASEAPTAKPLGTTTGGTPKSGGAGKPKGKGKKGLYGRQ